EELAKREHAYVAVCVSEPERAAALLREAGFADVVREPAGPHGAPALRIPDAADRSAEIARLLVAAGLELTALTPTAEDLESYFLRLTGGTR
ncbi:MAG TPA: ABC transporter ATP-binding protein, partial [Coriobacteriia bacterium]